MRVLFTTQPGHGHLQPMAPYARALMEAGDEVRVATSPGFCAAVEALGLTPVPVGVDFTWERPTDRFPQLADAARAGTMSEALREIVFDHWTPSAFADLRPVAEAWRADLVVREVAEHAGVAIAQTLGVPSAVSIWGAPATDPTWEAAGMPYAVVRRMYQEHTGSLGLPADPMAYWAQELALSSLPPSWISPDLDPRPPIQHFRMPPLDGAGEQKTWDAGFDGRRPLVYATLGTVHGWDRSLRDILLAAFADLHADVVLTIGRNADPDRVTAPPNVRVERYVPQSLLMPQVDAVVSHAGLGTMIGAVAAGVPLVLLDLGADHPMNAARARALGIAETFTRSDVRPDALRAAVERVLQDPDYRARASALADEYAGLPPAAACVDVLRDYAAQSRQDEP